jgi:hypothetical protein
MGCVRLGTLFYGFRFADTVYSILHFAACGLFDFFNDVCIFIVKGVLCAERLQESMVIFAGSSNDHGSGEICELDGIHPNARRATPNQERDFLLSFTGLWEAKLLKDDERRCDACKRQRRSFLKRQTIRQRNGKSLVDLDKFLIGTIPFLKPTVDASSDLN